MTAAIRFWVRTFEASTLCRDPWEALRTFWESDFLGENQGYGWDAPLGVIPRVPSHRQLLRILAEKSTVIRPLGVDLERGFKQYSRSPTVTVLLALLVWNGCAPWMVTLWISYLFELRVLLHKMLWTIFLKCLSLGLALWGQAKPASFPPNLPLWMACRFEWLAESPGRIFLEGIPVKKFLWKSWIFGGIFSACWSVKRGGFDLWVVFKNLISWFPWFLCVPLILEL